MSDGAARTSADDPFEHRIRVPYGDCDMQGVVFNATYVAYLDDTVDVWLKHRLGPDYLTRFDYAVKKAAIEWSDAVRPRDLLTLVNVRPGQHTSVAVPDDVRQALDPAATV